MVQFKEVFFFSDDLNDATYLSFINKFEHYQLSIIQLSITS